MGAHHEGESFGLDYELPPDRSYSETCAGVATVLLGHRLLLATGDATFADAVERTLFNVVSTSPAADGLSFYYTNTLHQRVPGAVPESDRPSPRASSSLRAPWFEVSCCPTNVARTLASLAAYVATVDDDGLQLHQYAECEVRTRLPNGESVGVRVQTRYPADGDVRVEILDAPSRPWTLSLRVPQWAASGATVTTGDEERSVAPGYVTLRRAFQKGDAVQLTLPLSPRWTWPHPRIDAVRGTVAVERGPLVLCMESVDLGASVNDVRVDTSVPPRDRDGVAHVVAATVDTADPSWPYGSRENAVAGPELREVPLVPYHQWANRGPATMRVWLPVLEH
jgi:DUF1680 family protein